MKKSFYFLILFLLVCHFSYTQSFKLKSPDNNIEVTISNKSDLQFAVHKNGEVMVPEVKVSMTLYNGRELGHGDKIKNSTRASVSKIIYPVVAIKNNQIRDKYNELTLLFKEDFKVIFRAYNDAVAYRFVTQFKDSIIVKNERCDIKFPDEASAWFSFLDGKDNLSDKWMNEYQHLYSKRALNDWGDSKITELPLLIGLRNGKKVLITESDKYSYPSLYFEKGESGFLKAIFPPKVKSEKKNVKGEKGWDRTIHPETVYDYIAKTSGNRTFPWRIMAIADKDIDLLNNEIVYQLATPNKLKSTDWIRPGQVAWDWWNHWNITGVDFKAGINTDTYKYYIDFAARNGIPYIIMDDGWYVLGDLTKVVPEIDMQILSDYAKKKGVDIILWCSWYTLNQEMEEALDLFMSWGVKGIKVDFMRRDDQDMVDFYWRCAEAAAQRNMLVNFHGSYNPVGLERTYPNIVNYESVSGLEQAKWSNDRATPEMAVSLPFIRMFTGPMDYTPGAMRNARKRDFRAINDYPMSLGTRCQQLAMYVLYDAPLQMLADNPTIYEKNKECLDFITSVPTTWDRTIPLSGEVGEYIVMAREHEKEYFLGAMTNWNARDVVIDFSFLPEGEWNIEIIQDGVNADRNAIDYKKIIKKVERGEKMNIHLAPGGGWAAKVF